MPTEMCQACLGSGRCSDLRCWCLSDVCHRCNGTKVVQVRTDINVDWANEHPEQAVGMLPEVERYLRWRNSPYMAHAQGEPKYDRSPRTFRTRGGREIT